MLVEFRLVNYLLWDLTSESVHDNVFQGRFSSVGFTDYMSSEDIDIANPVHMKTVYQV